MSSAQSIIDHNFLDEAHLPYLLLDSLGHGGCGTVEKVKDTRSHKVYARKTIRITGSGYGKVQRTRDTFQNEVSIIRGLERHRHIIRVHATYYTKRYFGILLDPVASDGDLEDYIDEYYAAIEAKAGSTVASMTPIMEKAFGCLAAGLAFMHRKKIRHKDIKPRNILVHNGRMIYTDFGYSFDSNGFTHSATHGIAEHFTRRYSSPEVLEKKPRNSTSDVFSLGCVFIDLLFALAGHGVPVAEGGCFADVIEHLHQQVLSTEIPPRLDALPRIIVHMTNRNSSHRVCSSHTAAELLQISQHRCDECAASPIEEWTARVEGDGCVISAISSSHLSPDPQVSLIQSSQGSTTTPVRASSSFLQAIPSAWSEEPKGHGKEPKNHTNMTLSTFTRHGWSTDWVDRGYYMRTGTEAIEFFLPGRVFSTLHADVDNSRMPTGTARSESALYTNKSTQTRRFIIVQRSKAKQLILACEIDTYGNLGTLKPGCDPSGHAIVHTANCEPTCLTGEKGMDKEPIAINPIDPTTRLEPASRLNFGMTHRFRWDIMVKDEGFVVDDQIVKLVGYHRQEQTDQFSRVED